MGSRMMGDDARNAALNLMNQKAKIEEEISRNGDILRQNGVGMHDPLVDEEGYPLATVDVYAVRHARQRIICLQNDYKRLLRDMEVALGAYYGGGGVSEAGARRSGATAAAVTGPRRPAAPSCAAPFARVTSVTEGSPAQRAGLAAGDLVLQLGSVSGANFKDMGAVANVVRHSEDASVPVTVLRQGRTLTLSLRPARWPGSGLLGCTILPLEHIDR